MLRKVRRSLALATGLLALGSASPAVPATSKTAHASAAILQWIALSETTAMSFANIMPAPSGGQVVLSTTGALAPAAGFLAFGTPSAGAFTAKSAPFLPAVISVSTGNTVTGPGTAMPLDTYTDGTAGIFDHTGNLRIPVGARLTINAHQAPGSYSGTYTVTVNF